MVSLSGRSILVSGRVQGVFYRASTVAEAHALGLTGWAKNLANGDVLIEAFGREENIEKLILWCKQGPPMAHVSSVKVSPIPYRNEESFRVIY